MLQNREDFFNTVNHDFKKVNFTYSSWKNGSMFMFNNVTKSDPIYECTSDVFNYIKDNSVYEKNLPLMSWRINLTNKLIANGYNESLIYNHPTSLSKFTKLDIAHSLNELNISWQPKTVFSKNDAIEKLNFPIIAKTNESYQSKGIMRFNTKEDFLKYRYLEDFSLYQEYVPLVEEIRLMMFRGKNATNTKCIMALSKKPISNKLKRIHESDNNQQSQILEEDNYAEYTADYSKSEFSVPKKEFEKADFKWYYLDHIDLINKYESSINEITNTIFSLNPQMNFITIDLGVLENNTLTYIESNKTPGMSYHSSMLLYNAIFEDFYNRTLTKNSYTKLKEKAQICKNVTNSFEQFNIDKELIFENYLIK